MICPVNQEHEFDITGLPAFKIQLLNWANRFPIFCFLDNNGFNSGDSAFDFCLAAGAEKIFSNDLSSIQLRTNSKSWLFGHIGFECFDQDPLIASEPFVDFGKSFFFEPKHLIMVSGSKLKIFSHWLPPEKIYAEISALSAQYNQEGYQINFKHALTRQEYLNRLDGIFAHIQRGDCYEINFCQHFYAEEVHINPIEVFCNLNLISANPFAALYRLQNRYCICASPERFLQKKGMVLRSEPIKGTERRSIQPEEDKILENKLTNSYKDRTENVMIVDLVRNDLSIICEEGSVAVPSMYKVKPFPGVHHMVSTITGLINNGVTFLEIMKACFPMGSMTGAPKKRVLELIKEYEKEPRGLFSGTIGYINPLGDFDFNVVIRSLMYDAEKKIISLKTGGGITAGSIAEEEYEESLLKAAAGMEVLNRNY